VKDLRIAFFTDSYLEVNGVALTSRRFEDFARRRNLPFLIVHAGQKTQCVTENNSIQKLELKRSSLAISMDAGLAFDPFFQRHNKIVRQTIKAFQPHVIHITGLNDVGIMGVWTAHRLDIPVLASWHTNLHEFAAARLHKLFNFVPANTRSPIINFAEKQILRGAILYYKIGKVILAPNQELVDVLREGTKREAFLMTRGVDTEIYSPAKRQTNDNIFRLGFVGRLQPEKNVRVLAEVEKTLIKAGKSDYEFLIVGDGSDRAWLEKNIKRARFTGFLEGEELARTYAEMDLFVFPSETETYGNVVQEALASGVPAIVSNVGGAKYLIEPGATGYIAETTEDYGKFTLRIMNNRLQRGKMSEAARKFALARSWDAVFEQVYQAYGKVRAIHQSEKAAARKFSAASLPE
jgi:phosphatidylinositol alpha 1,6-mannosyltransferase